MKQSLALVGLVLLLFSCASMQHSRDQSGMLSVARLIDTGQSGTLARLSAMPFLLDQEILLLPVDVASFWKIEIQVSPCRLSFIERNLPYLSAKGEREACGITINDSSLMYFELSSCINRFPIVVSE